MYIIKINRGIKDVLVIFLISNVFVLLYYEFYYIMN